VDSDLERIVPLREEGSAVPLFCVHAVSGSAYSYTGLVQMLEPDQPVYAFEAPGFDGDRAPVRSLPDLSAEYVATLREFRPTGEYRLLGWSLGGVLAFDMAQRLTALGASVSRLIMVDVGLPWVADLPPEKEIQRRFMADLLAIAGAPPQALDAVFAQYPDDGVDPSALFAAVEAAEVLPEEIDADMMLDRYAVFRAHIEALFAFEVTVPYHGPVVHITAAESQKRWMRWDTVAPNLTEYTIPGSHHSIWTGDSLVQMGDLVRKILAGH
jgi:thioesterase domain-containing protein